MQRKAINISSSGDNTIITQSLPINVMKMFLVAKGAVDVTFKDANGALTGPMPITANGGLVWDFDGKPWLVSQTSLIINLSGAVQVSGVFSYK